MQQLYPRYALYLMIQTHVRLSFSTLVTLSEALTFSLLSAWGEIVGKG